MAGNTLRDTCNLIADEEEDTGTVTLAESVDLGSIHEPSLIELHGAQIGKLHILGKPTMLLGRDSRMDLVVHVQSVSRCHARLEQHGDTILVEDLNSTNGTFINDSRISKGTLHDGDLLKVGGTILKFLACGNPETSYHDQIYHMATMDGLTRIPNKRFCLEHLAREMSRAKRHQRPISILMFDIDHFKEVNDRYGHLAGDRILVRLVQILKGRIRKEDLFGRFGGEEFMIISTETTEPKARRFAEKLRALVERTDFRVGDQIVPITISIGVLQMPFSITDPLLLVSMVDERMYAAKERGRNCVVAGT